MSEPIANPNAKLEMLVSQIMKEKDHLKYDALCAELRRVLEERGGCIGVESTPSGKCASDGKPALCACDHNGV